MTKDEMTLLSKGRVPVEVILPPVLARLRLADSDRTGDEPGELTLLCERQDLEYGTIAKIIHRFENPGAGDGAVSLDFTTADKLLCGANLHDMWWGVLSDYYYGVDLSWKKCECEGCETWFQLRQDTLGRYVAQKYCSQQCNNAAYKLRSGRIQQRLALSRRGKIGRPVGTVETKQCRNGHKRTPENTKFRGNGKMECLICHRASAKRAYERKQAKGTLVAA